MFRDHSFLSAFGPPWQSDFLDALGFPVVFWQAMGFSRTAPFLKNSRFQVPKGPHPLIPLLLRQVSPWLCPSTRQGMHLAVALENSTQLRISNFFSSCFRVSPVAVSIPRPLDARRTCRNMRRQVHRCRFRFCHTSFFFLLFLHPFSHRFWCSLSSWNSQRSKWSWNGWCWTNVKDCSTHHVWNFPLLVCLRVGIWCRHIWYESWGPVQLPFGQNVCELMFGINVSNLNFRIKINPVKQLIQSNSVGSWHMSYCGTSAFFSF